MKYCPFCGQKVGGQSFKFCPQCGSALPAPANGSTPALNLVSPTPLSERAGTSAVVEDCSLATGEKSHEPEAERCASPRTSERRVNTVARTVCNLLILGVAMVCGYMIGLTSAASRMVTAVWSTVHGGAWAVLSRIPLASAMADSWSRQIADWVTQKSYGITPTQLSQGTGLLYVLAAALFVSSLAANLARWPGEK